MYLSLRGSVARICHHSRVLLTLQVKFLWQYLNVEPQPDTSAANLACQETKETLKGPHSMPGVVSQWSSSILSCQLHLHSTHHTVSSTPVIVCPQPPTYSCLEAPTAAVIPVGQLIKVLSRTDKMYYHVLHHCTNGCHDRVSMIVWNHTRSRSYYLPPPYLGLYWHSNISSLPNLIRHPHLLPSWHPLHTGMQCMPLYMQAPSPGCLLHMLWTVGALAYPLGHFHSLALNSCAFSFIDRYYASS